MNDPMSNPRSQCLTLLIVLFVLAPLRSQTIPKDELIYLTSEWQGDRFADGRPKISDDLISRARKIGIDDAWTVLENEGYRNQFEGNWKMVHDDVPVVGRAVTAMFMPSRPDVVRLIKERGNQQGRKGDTNSWPIEELVPGDIYVADSFGKIDAGTLIGATLATSIFQKSGNGVVFNGSARDLETISQIKGFNAFVRDFHPSFLEDEVLTGLNVPIRIGQAMVLPGDLVLAKREGVLFIPAHLAAQVVATAEFVALKDQFGFEMVKSGKFAPGEIDSQWTETIKKAFMTWLDEHPELGSMSRQELDLVLSKRTW